MPPLILTARDGADRRQMGGKAAALARLEGHFTIPPWLVVTPAAFAQHGLSAAARQALAAALPHLGAGPFAVRSSAVDEDGSAHSFAGQLLSVLQVPAEQVAQEVDKVWQSAFTPSLNLYRQQRGLAPHAGAPAVLIQCMVQPQVAGVAFSADPVRGIRDRILVAAIAGLADQLVAGEASGDSYTLNHQGDTLEQTLIGPTPLLNEAEKRQVAALALAAQEFFHAPQDVEWALAQGCLYLLQARPITTLHQDPVTLWDNANIVESYPGITLPFTFSFARYVYGHVYRAFCGFMGVSGGEIDRQRVVFDHMLGLIHGRVYYNLLNWYRVLALFPGFRLNRRFMEQMMGVGESLPPEMIQSLLPNAVSWREKLWDGVRLTRTLFSMVGQAIILPATIRAFERRLQQALAEPQPGLQQQSPWQLVGTYRQLEESLLRHWDAPLINDFLCMIAFGLSRAALVAWCGEKEGKALHNHFMIGQGDILSAEPGRRIRHMARLARGDDALVQSLMAGEGHLLQENKELAAAFQEYLTTFGDRCTEELKMESLTLHDDPSPLRRAIGFAARRQEEASPAGEEDAGQRLNTILAGRPLVRGIARVLIALAKARVRDRENLRFQRTRLFGRVRRIFLALGQRLADQGLLLQPRDVFYLEMEEILGLVEGTATLHDPKPLVTLRRDVYARHEATPPPPARLETVGAVALSLSRASRQAPPAVPSTDHLLGTGCCQGVVRGPVRLIRDPRQEGLQAGEILVARTTDPGWIALFCNAAGILVERGSLLSHSAIVAREMGIPAIVSLPGLMDWLESGQWVEMNGETGLVQKLDGEK